MIAKETKKLVALACKSEVDNAKSYGEFYNSPHEAYAVLKEEIEETEENLKSVKNYMNEIWSNIRKNEKDELTLNVLTLNSYALMLIYEAMQVYAVSEKFRESF